jgi:hypothetical protein
MLSKTSCDFVTFKTIEVNKITKYLSILQPLLAPSWFKKREVARVPTLSHLSIRKVAYSSHESRVQMNK